MAFPPPPFSNIAGTSQVIAKYNQQESIGNVDGNARPGQLIVDLETDPPQLYVGNNAGNITLVASGGGSTGNWVFSGNNAKVNNSGYPHLWGGPSGGPEFSYLEEAGNLASYSQTMYINSPEGFVVSLDYGNSEMVFDTTGNLNVPGSIITSGPTGNITGANVISANTFTTTTGNIYIAPDDANLAAHLDIYLTGGPDIHIGSNVQNLIMGADAGANVTINAGGQVAVQAYDYGNTTSHTWTFGTLGSLQLPVVTFGNLPAATTPGLRAFISDANLAPATNFGVQVSGGGGNYVPVFSDGANWCIG